MYKAFLIDLDGTLLNNLPFYINAYQKTLSFFGLSLSKKEIVEHCLGRKEIDACTYLGIPEKFEEYRKVYSENKRLLFQDIHLFPGAEDFLNRAKDKEVVLVLNSIARRWYVDMVLSKVPILKYFEATLSFDDVRDPKPSPDPVLKIEGLFKISPQDCLVIGDALGDIEMGKAAGSKTVLFFPKENQDIYGSEWAKELQSDFVVDSFEALETLVFS